MAQTSHAPSPSVRSQERRDRSERGGWALQSSINEITWRSIRVTFLSEAVKNNADDKAVGLQANWRDPGQLVLKYARQRKEISAAMVKGVASKIKEAWTPPASSFVVEEDEDSAMQEPLKIEYILKASLPSKALSSSDFRCHIMDPSAGSEGSICGRLKMVDAVSVGHIAPGMICQHCSAKIQEWAWSGKVITGQDCQ